MHRTKVIVHDLYCFSFVVFISHYTDAMLPLSYIIGNRVFIVA